MATLLGSQEISHGYVRRYLERHRISLPTNEREALYTLIGHHNFVYLIELERPPMPLKKLGQEHQIDVPRMQYLNRLAVQVLEKYRDDAHSAYPTHDLVLSAESPFVE